MIQSQDQTVPVGARDRMSDTDRLTAAVLYDRHLKDMLHYVLRRVPRIEEAEDITAEVFAAAAAALLVYFQLCRVAALGLPLQAGLARGLRHTTPYAIAMLVALYLVALVPTVAAERAIEQRIVRSIAGETL